MFNDDYEDLKDEYKRYYENPDQDEYGRTIRLIPIEWEYDRLDRQREKDDEDDENY